MFFSPNIVRRTLSCVLFLTAGATFAQQPSQPEHPCKDAINAEGNVMICLSGANWGAREFLAYRQQIENDPAIQEFRAFGRIRKEAGEGISSLERKDRKKFRKHVRNIWKAMKGICRKRDVLCRSGMEPSAALSQSTTIQLLAIVQADVPRYLQGITPHTVDSKQGAIILEISQATKLLASR
ncbi:MAG TPA: hypothetical protein VMA75_02760 [Candidatus Paceibacterota bacterium]|nr:hypothetical protein [Candidatus Paceibacterota bacterium]